MRTAGADWASNEECPDPGRCTWTWPATRPTSTPNSPGSSVLGARLVAPPRREPYGSIANLCDPDGNPFDLCAYH